MPASLYESTLSLERIAAATSNHSSAISPTSNMDNMEDNRAVKLAYELAMLGLDSGAASPNGHHHHGLSMDSLNINSATLAQLEELKTRKSQNMTECVPVPTSEHVAEIVGRQGCKIKALRAKTNTYIKTPVRGEEPVFVVTGRKEDVNLAKREILSAADHFSQIRASRKNNINSTLAFGQMVANTPGQTTIQVRVPYRVVGLVVGPKGATIKRIQQQTHTYIVTPSRDKEPVFEVTGLPENVDSARKEIESHIALRTGSGIQDGWDTDADTANSFSNSAFTCSASSALSMPDSRTDNLLINKMNSGNCMMSANSNMDQLQLHRLDSLIESNNFGGGGGGKSSSREISIGSALWGCSDSHDSGIGHSPPYDSSHSLSGLTNGSSAIWNELGKVLGNLDCSPDSSGPGQSSHQNTLNSVAISKPSPTTPRSASIDLGIPLSTTNTAFNTTLTNGCGSSSSSSTSSHQDQHQHHNNINHHHHQQQQQLHNNINNPTSAAAADPFKSFSLNGLSLANLSASLNTLNENNVVNGGGNGDAGDILACLRRNGSPDVEMSSDKIGSAFLDHVSKPNVGMHRDFLSFANH